EAAAVPPRLVQDAGHVDAHLLRLDDGHEIDAEEDRVVDGAGDGGPLGDGDVDSLLRPGAERVGEGARVRLPPGLAELSIDDVPRVRFAELDRVAGSGGGTKGPGSNFRLLPNARWNQIASSRAILS